MAYPGFVITNRAWLSDVTISARNESAIYPASNLQTASIGWYRTDNTAVNLNGTNEDLSITDASQTGLDLSTEAKWELVFEPGDVATTDNLVSKWDTGTPDKSYLIERSGVNLRIKLSGDGTAEAVITTTSITFAANTSERIVVEYIGTGTATVKVWQGLTLRATATNASQTNCTLTGTIPASLHNSAADFVVGSDNSNRYWEGMIDLVGIKNTIDDNPNYIEDPATDNDVVGYWQFNGDGTDESSNSNDLTENNLADSNYVAFSAYQWIKVDYSAYNAASDNKYFYIHRKHNVATGTVNIHCLDSGDLSNIDSISASTDQPLAVNASSSPSTNVWYFEFVPTTHLNYIEIPAISIGQLETMTRGFNLSAEYANNFLGDMITTRGGGVTMYAYTDDRLWERQTPWKVDTAHGSDFDILDRAIKQSQQANPFVFVYDTDFMVTSRLVQIINSLGVRWQHVYNTRYNVSFNIRELGWGV